MGGVCSLAVAAIFPPDMVAGCNYRETRRVLQESSCPRVAPTVFYNIPGPSRTFSSCADIEQSGGRKAGAEWMWQTPRSPCSPVPPISWLPHGLDMPCAGARQGRQGWGEEEISAACSHLPALATAITCTRSKPNWGPFQTATLCVLFPKGSSSFMCMQNG